MTTRPPIARVTIEYPIGAQPRTFEATDFDLAYTADEAEIELPSDPYRHFVPTGRRHLVVSISYDVET